MVPSHFHRETTCITELWPVTLREKRAITKYLPNMTFSLAVCCFMFLLTKFSCCWASLFFGSILSTSSKSFFARSSSLIDNLAWWRVVKGINCLFLKLRYWGRKEHWEGKMARGNKAFSSPPPLSFHNVCPVFLLGKRRLKRTTAQSVNSTEINLVVFSQSLN